MKHSYSYVAMPLMFELPEYEFKLLAALINFANIYQNKTFYKSAKELMDAVNNHGRKSFYNAIEDLKERGLIETKRNFNKPNTFTINFDNFPNQIKEDEDKAKNTPTDTSDTVGSIQDHPTDTSDTVGSIQDHPLVPNETSKKETKNIESTIMNTTTMNKYSTSQTQEAGRLDFNLKNRLIARVQSVVREMISTGADTVDLKRWFYDEAKPKMMGDESCAQFSKAIEGEFYKELRMHFTDDEINLRRKMTDKDLDGKLKKRIDDVIRELNSGVVLQTGSGGTKWLYGKIGEGIRIANTSIEAKYFTKRLISIALQKRVKIDKDSTMEWYNNEINKIFNIA